MDKHFIYTHLDVDVHRVEWIQINVAAIESYIQLFIKLVNAMSDGGVFKILHDYSKVDTPSFTAMANAMKKLTVPDGITVRIAHVYSDNSYPMIVKNATLVARFNANRKFFKVGEEQQAIVWLINE